MKEMKREYEETVDENNNIIKKAKLSDEINRSVFEELPNEMIYEFFQYLNVYHIYSGFFNLNTRLRNVVLHCNVSIEIDIPLISKSTFENYTKDLIKPNRFRIQSIRLSMNPFLFDFIYSPPRFLCQFVQLEILIIDHFDTKYLKNMFQHLISLPKFHRLTLSLLEPIADVSCLFIYLFRLPHLKTCQLTYQSKKVGQPSSISLYEKRQSSIENLTIHSEIRFDSFTDLFVCLPNVRYLSIDSLLGSYSTNINRSSAVLKHLKHLSIKLDGISFETLENLGNYHFHSVEVFFISIVNNYSYLSPQRWQQLIENFLPNLRIFDLNYVDGERENEAWFHFLILMFNGSLWHQKNWSFDHQHDYRDNKDHGILYSTNPYRRKEMIFHWKSCKDYYRQVIVYQSVEHLHIYGQRATFSRNYFPNVNELTLGNSFQTSDQSISITLNRLLPLKQLKILFIPEFQFPFEELLNILHSTPNLHTLKLNFLLVFQINMPALEQNPIFQSVIKTNQIKYFHLNQTCTLETLQFILKLCPNVEYLQIGMVTRQINEILLYLFTKTNQIHLLCFTKTPKYWLKQLNTFIQSKHLIENYSIKLIHRNLYLWW